MKKTSTTAFRSTAALIAIALFMSVSTSIAYAGQSFAGDTSISNTDSTGSVGGDASTNSAQDTSSTFVSDSSTTLNQDNSGSFGSDSSTNNNQDASGSYGSNSSNELNQDNSSADITAPVLSSVSDISTTTTTTGVIVTYTLPRALDARDGSIVPVCTPASGSFFSVGSTLVTCTATDAAHNSASTTFNIVVTSTTTSSENTNGGSAGITNNTSITSFGGGSGSGFNGTVLGTSTLSSASTTLACPFLTSFVLPGKANSAENIAKVQLFLNVYANGNLKVNGILDQATIDAIKSFQSAHLSDTMGPWGSTLPSGNVYITTLKTMNAIACGSSKPLTADELAIIAAFKGQSDHSATASASTDSSVTSISSTDISTGSTTASTTTTVGDTTNLTGNALSSVGNIFKSFFKKIASWF